MNERLDTQAIVDWLVADIANAPTGTQVLRSSRSEFAKEFGKTYPAVWVRTQRSRPLDDGDGWTSEYRQNVQIDVAFTVVEQRYMNGSVDNGDALKTLYDWASNRLIGWVPPGCDFPLTWALSNDGPDDESVLYINFALRTQATYAKASA